MKLEDLKGKEVTEQINLIKTNPRLELKDIEENPDKLIGKTIVFLTDGIQLKGIKSIILVFEYSEEDEWFEYDKDLSSGSKTYSCCLKMEGLINRFQTLLRRSYGYLLS